MTSVFGSLRLRLHERRLRRQLRRWGRILRAEVTTSGLKEWSDKELVRLRPDWARTFRRRTHIKAWILFAVALASSAAGTMFFGFSVERYAHWTAAAQAVETPPVLAVKPWRRSCWENNCPKTVRAIKR